MLVRVCNNGSDTNFTSQMSVVGCYDYEALSIQKRDPCLLRACDLYLHDNTIVHVIAAAMALESARDLCFWNAVSSRYQVECCAFSPRENLLAACFSNGSVRLYRLHHKGRHAEGGAGWQDDCKAEQEFSIKLERCFSDHCSNVWCVTFSSDGELLASCSSDRTVRIYSMKTLSLSRLICYHTDTVWSCCFSSGSNSDLIASGSSDATVKIFSARTCEIVHDLAGFEDAVECVDFSPDGLKLCTACRDGRVLVWIGVGRDGTHAASFLIHTDDTKWSRLCKFSPFSNTDNILVTSTSSHDLLVWDIQHIQDCATGAEQMARKHKRLRPKRRLTGHCNEIWGYSFAFSEGQTLLISCSGDKTVRFVVHLVSL